MEGENEDEEGGRERGREQNPFSGGYITVLVTFISVTKSLDKST